MILIGCTVPQLDTPLGVDIGSPNVDIPGIFDEASHCASQLIIGLETQLTAQVFISHTSWILYESFQNALLLPSDKSDKSVESLYCPPSSTIRFRRLPSLCKFHSTTTLGSQFEYRGKGDPQFLLRVAGDCYISEFDSESHMWTLPYLSVDFSASQFTIKERSEARWPATSHPVTPVAVRSTGRTPAGGIAPRACAACRVCPIKEYTLQAVPLYSDVLATQEPFLLRMWICLRDGFGQGGKSMGRKKRQERKKQVKSRPVREVTRAQFLADLRKAARRVRPSPSQASS